MLRLVAVLAVGAAASAPAQLAVTQPTEKLLVLPLMVSSSADSATSIAVMDAARERLSSLARYKVLLVSKSKMCEALAASGFPCDGLMDTRQAEQLARFLSVNSWTLGTLSHNSSTLTAQIHVVSGGSGFSATFTATGGPTGSPQPLSEAIAQRLNAIIRGAEYARNCNELRGRGNFQKALEEARRGLAIEPGLAALHLCVASVYEAERLGLDSIIAAALRAQKGDSLNGAAINLEANAWLQKGDTARWLDALIKLTRSDIHNMNTALGVGTLFLTHKKYVKGVALMNEVLAANPGNQQLMDLKRRLCIEGEQWRCVLDMLGAQAKADTAVLGDSVTLRIAIGAAQAISDTQNLLFWTRGAVRHFPTSTTYLKAEAAAFELAGQHDSSLAVEIKALQLNPNDVNLSLLIAKAIVDRAAFDSAAFKRCQTGKDSLCLRSMQTAFANKVDSARPYLRPGLASADSGQRLTAAAIMLSAGSRLAQNASAYDRAYPWLDTLLTLVAPRTAADTIGPRQQVRASASFWFGLSSVLTLQGPYKRMIDSKNCEEAKVINDRLVRTRAALELGHRVHPPTVDQMLRFLRQYESNMPKVKQAFKCRNF
jgi:tetratricopeptide (TPR) repeat protein